MKIVIVAAKRTAIGSFLGAFKEMPAVTLAATVTRDILAGMEASDVTDVVVGNVLQAGQGMNPARQIALVSGLPVAVPGQTINRVCASGMQAVISVVQALKAGDGQLYLAGGTENMSRSPFLLGQMRAGHKLGDASLIDSMVNDGLTDPTHRYHMGVTAENVAAKFGISRAEQDAFALESHRRATAAQLDGSFAEQIVPVTLPGSKGDTVLAMDESVRADTSLEALAKLKPVFLPDGTVTAGNASSLNDGAAMLALCTGEYAAAHGITTCAEVLSYATTGVDPALMGTGPAAAVPIALHRAGLATQDINLFELNEAFASQALAVIRSLGLDPAIVNPSGGAIALGHPIGCSGARVLVTLLHGLKTRGQEFGVASLCVGGGMGIAMVLRRI
jgi:acetyl-CoA C-acetyltransferase